MRSPSSVAAVLLLLLPALAQASPPRRAEREANAPASTHALDPYWWDGFALPIPETRVEAVTTFNGKTIIGGSFTAAGTTRARYAAAWNGAGWEALGAGPGFPVYGFVATGGGPVAVGSRNGLPGEVATVKQWNGTAWTTLGATNGDVRAAIIFEGDLVIGGSFSTVNGVAAARVARWNGATWSAVGSGLSGVSVRAFAVHEGKLVAGGQLAPHVNVASWDGVSWSTVGAGLPNPIVEGLRSFGTELYAARSSGVWRWNGSLWQSITPSDNTYAIGDWAGSPVATFGSGPDIPQIWNGTSWSPAPSTVIVTARAYGSNGPLLYAGGSGAVDGNLSSLFSYDGVTWQNVQEPWAPGMSGVTGFATHAFEMDGKLVVAGNFFNVAAEDHWVAAPRGAAWDGASWTPFAAPVQVWCSTQHAGQYYTGHQTGVSRWTGTAWVALGSMLSGGVEDLTSHQGELLAVASFFSDPNYGVARWNGSTWVQYGGPFAENDWPYAVLSTGTDLYVGGFVTSAGGTPVSGIAHWNGVAYDDLGGGVDGRVFDLVEFEGDVIAAGEFTQAGGAAAAAVARWNGSAWAPMGDNARWIEELRVVGGRLFAVGEFELEDASRVQALAVWNGQTWQTLGSGFDGSPYGIAEYGGDLYVTGVFGYANGRVASNIARFQGLSVLGVDEHVAGATLRLSSPRPNPAARGFRVDYVLPTAGAARVTIHDLQGREVATLASGDHAAGSHSARWSGADRRLAPGVYVVRLASNGRSASTRVAVIE